MSVDSIGAGKDHATVTIWEAQFTDPLTEDETGEVTGEITETVTFSGFALDGFTVHLTAAAGESFEDNITAGTDPLYWNTSSARLTGGTSAHRLTISVPITVDRMQFENTAFGGMALNVGGAGSIIERNIFRITSGAGGAIAVCQLDGDNTTRGEFRHNLVICENANRGIKIFKGFNIHYNTIVAPATATGGSIGIVTQFIGSLKVRVKNNAVYGFTEWVTETNVGDYDDANSGNNVTDDTADADDPDSGSTNIYSSTYADAFVDDDTDFSLQDDAQCDARAAAAVISGVTESILGDTRDGSTPDIGAYEIPAVGGPFTIEVGQAVETDTAFGIGVVRAVALGLAAEADAGQVIIPLKGKTIELGLAAETDIGQIIRPRRDVGVGLAGESDTAFPIGIDKSVLLGLANEADTAGALTRIKSVLLGLAGETDEAFAVAPGTGVLVGIASETDTAFPVGTLKEVLLGLASEIDSALTMDPLRSISIGLAAETDVAQTIGILRTLLLGLGL